MAHVNDIYIYIYIYYFLFVTVRGYHWISTHIINIYFLNVLKSQCYLLLYIQSTYVENLALIGCLFKKLLLADHVCRSHWISAHMTNTFSLQLVTGTIYKTEPTVALGQTDLVSIET